MNSGSYRAIKLFEHGMKVMERVIECRLQEIVDVDAMQFGFMPGRGTTDLIFIDRQLLEKCIEKNRNLYFAFIDLEKAFDRVPRRIVQWSLRKMWVGEWLVKARWAWLKYKKSLTIVRTNHGNCEEFDVKVGVYQGSDLSQLFL